MVQLLVVTKDGLSNKTIQQNILQGRWLKILKSARIVLSNSFYSTILVTDNGNAEYILFCEPLNVLLDI